MPYTINLKFRNEEDFFYQTEVEECETISECNKVINYYKAFNSDVVFTITRSLNYIVATEKETDLLDDNSREIIFTETTPNIEKVVEQLKDLRSEAAYMKEHQHDCDTYLKDFEALDIAIKLIKLMKVKED